jgi:hypothetical protein
VSDVAIIGFELRGNLILRSGPEGRHSVVLSKARFTAPSAKDLIAACNRSTLRLLAMRSFAYGACFASALLRMTQEKRVAA